MGWRVNRQSQIANRKVRASIANRKSSIVNGQGGSMIMTPEQLKARSKRFALEVIAVVGTLPRTLVADIISRQIVRSATSTGANYRAACRARSRAEFVAKLGVAEEEADETLYWLELLLETNLLEARAAEGLIKEAGELVAIFSAGRKTARKVGSEEQEENEG